MGSTEIRRVRTYRMTFRRNGGGSSKTDCWYVCTQQKSAKRSLSKQHIPSRSGCFDVHGLLKKVSVDTVCKRKFAGTASCRRADHGKRRRHFALVSRGHRSDRIPPPEEPSESPRHFAASMDESVIVGYYTLKKCLSVSPRCLQIPKKGQKIYGKK